MFAPSAVCTIRRPRYLTLPPSTDLNFWILENTTRDTTNVECSHRQLSARLTNRLSGNNTNRRTTLNHGVGRRIDTVFERSDTNLLTSGERRKDLHTLDAQIFDLLGSVLGDELHHS